MIEVTQEGRELAAQWANAEAELGLTPKNWKAPDFEDGCCASDTAALARRATQFLADKAALAELQASYDAAKADLVEIDRICRLPMLEQSISMIAPIAAPYRVETDPLVEAVEAVWGFDKAGVSFAAEKAVQLRAELAKHGIELAKVTV